jgi:methylenetetrahydrofolate--tRNA-(uracil-5-)-methyltransferase
MAGTTLAQLLEGREPVPLPFSTALGALSRHASQSDEASYAPMNVTFGLIDDADVPPIRDRAKRREEIVRRALESVALWRGAALGLPVPAGAEKGESS